MTTLSDVEEQISKRTSTHHTTDSHDTHLFVFVPTTQEMRSRCAETVPRSNEVSTPADCAQ